MATIALIKVLRANLKSCLQKGDLAEAEVLIAQLKSEDPLSVETRGMELDWLVAARRWEEARVLAEQLLALFPASARIHYLAGRVYYQGKDYGRALEHFRESDRIYPHRSVQRWLGKVHTQRGEYEAAEALLVGMAQAHPQVGLDLAWLYERREQPERALACLETYLQWRPDDTFAQAQRVRLRASLLAPHELVEEVDTLQDLGEAIPDELLPAYVQRLLETGQGAAAREFVAQRESGWLPRVQARVAWVCHRLQAYDLALRLFLLALRDHTHDFKYLSALESAARHCQRVDEVIRVYKAMAPDDRQFYGRIKRLGRR